MHNNHIYYTRVYTVIDLSGGWGVQPPSGASKTPKFSFTPPEKIVKNSQKYIPDPPPSGFTTNRAQRFIIMVTVM